MDPRGLPGPRLGELDAAEAARLWALLAELRRGEVTPRGQLIRLTRRLPVQLAARLLAVLDEGPALVRAEAVRLLDAIDPQDPTTPALAVVVLGWLEAADQVLAAGGSAQELRVLLSLADQADEVEYCRIRQRRHRRRPGRVPVDGRLADGCQRPGTPTILPSARGRRDDVAWGGAGPVWCGAMTLQGRVLAGRYALGVMLGAGGTAQVYRARDRVLQRTVAVKVLSTPYDQDPELVTRFGREARAAAALSHPNIVAVFDSGTDGDIHYLVMEDVDGETLAQLLRREGALAPRRAVGIGGAVCQALAAAHALWLVHRDITPSNVLVSSSGLVKVTDFGIAKLAAAATLTGSGTLLGTAAYLAPEQAQGRPVDARSDLYALGCVLYELLTGAPPFAGDSPVAVAARHVTEQPTPPSHRNPQVGADLEAVVLTALAKDPADRYQTATAMAQDLERVTDGHTAGSGPLPADPAGPPTDRLPSVVPSGSPTVALPQPGTARRPGRVAWALVAALGMVALLAAVLWQRGGDAPAVRQPTGPVATATPTTAPRQPQAGAPAALATLTEAVTAGQQQGTVDKSAEDLLKHAQEVLGAVQEGKAEDARKKLEDLHRKTDELIDQGKIRGAAAGRVRQAVTRFSQAVEPPG